MIDYRRASGEATFSEMQTIRAKVIDSAAAEAPVNRFLGDLCAKHPDAEIISVTRCGDDAVLILYRVPADEAA